MPTLSVVTPVYNESENLSLFYRELVETIGRLDGLTWEWIAVDDHSTDESPHVLRRLAESDRRVRYIRLAKNEGPHIAIAAGLVHSMGQCAVVMASDLQDRPDEIQKMLAQWNAGYHVVWMVREDVGEEQGYGTGLFGRLWYFTVRSLPGLSQMPSTGSDMFLVDRRVLEAVRNQFLRKVAMPILIRSMGFRQINLTYVKQHRQKGKSKWTLRRKVSHIVHTTMYFTNLPSRFVSLLGFTASGVTFLYAVFLIIHRIIRGSPVQGWHSIMVLYSLGFSLTMLILGILSEYVWRIFEYARKAPDYSIEDSSDFFSSDVPNDSPGTSLGNHNQ